MLRFMLRTVVFLVPIFQSLMGLLYPVLATTKAAIQEDSDACSGWLVYWAIYSIVALFETCCEWVISWLPLYPELKLAFVCWLVLPKFQGAALLYNRVLQDLFLEYEEQIDDQITSAQMEARKHVWSFLVYLVAEGTKIAGEKSSNALALFLRMSTFGSSQDVVDDDTVLAVASAITSAVNDDLNKKVPATTERTSVSSGTLITDASSSGKCEVERNRITSGIISGHDTGDNRAPKSGDFGSKSNGEEIEVLEADTNVDEAKLASAEEADVKEEANEDLLNDFLNVMEDGIYLNVSTAESPSQMRLRIVTLSDDSYRLIWIKLRDLRKANNTASSLHLCTVSATCIPRDLCVSLSTVQDGSEAVSFEAQSSEVHDVLSAGLVLLVTDAHTRGKIQLEPFFASFRHRILTGAFRCLAAFSDTK